MRFYFVANDENMLKPAAQGGCGVTANEIEAVTVWQKVMEYKFEFHNQNHGDYVYIFPEGWSPGKKDMPRFYFGGGKQGEFDNVDSLNSKVQKDVDAVVTNNYGLFAAMHGRFYNSTGPNNVAVTPVAAPAMLTCPKGHSFPRPNPHLIQNDMTTCPNCGEYVYAG